MRVDIFHHHSIEARCEVMRRLDILSDQIDLIKEYIMSAMDDLKASVQKNTDAESSVITLLQGLSAQLKDAKAANDPAAIQAVIDQIDKNTASAAAAVVENTPAAPPTP